MPIGVQQTIFFDFQNTVAGIQSPVGLFANGTLLPGSSASFENALDGITFTYSAGGSISFIDQFGVANN